MANPYVQIGKFLLEEFGDDALRAAQRYYAKRGASAEERAELRDGIAEALRQVGRNPADFFGPWIGVDPGEPARHPDGPSAPSYGLSFSLGHEPSDADLSSGGYGVTGDSLYRHWQVERTYRVLKAGTGEADSRWIFVRMIG